MEEGEEGQHWQLPGALDGQGSFLLEKRGGRVRSGGAAGVMSEGLVVVERRVPMRTRRKRTRQPEELAAEGER